MKGKRFSFISMPLIYRFNKIAILGVPDIVVFFASKPLYVMEPKTTKRMPYVWPDSWLQAQIYAYLLDRMNFDCSKLNVMVASISQSGEIAKGAFFNELLKAIIEKGTDDFVRKWKCKMQLEPYYRDLDFVEDKVE